MLAFSQRFMKIMMLTGVLALGLLTSGDTCCADKPAEETGKLPKLTPVELEELREINQLLPQELQIRLFSEEETSKTSDSSPSNQKKVRTPAPVFQPPQILETQKLSYQQVMPTRLIHGKKDSSHSLIQIVQSIRLSAKDLEDIAASLESEALYESSDLMREKARTLWLTARDLVSEHHKAQDREKSN